MSSLTSKEQIKVGRYQNAVILKDINKEARKYDEYEIIDD